MSESSPTNSKKTTNLLTIGLFDDITEETVEQFLEVLILAQSAEDKTPLYVFFNSNGGDMVSSVTLYYLIHNLPLPTIAVNLGKVYSGALLPFMACQRRVALPHSSFLIHNIKSSYDIDYVSPDWFTHHTQYIQHLADIWKNTLTQLLPPEVPIEHWLQSDTYFFAEDALKLGLIHEIVTEVL